MLGHQQQCSLRGLPVTTSFNYTRAAALFFLFFNNFFFFSFFVLFFFYCCHFFEYLSVVSYFHLFLSKISVPCFVYLLFDSAVTEPARPIARPVVKVSVVNFFLNWTMLRREGMHFVLLFTLTACTAVAVGPVMNDAPPTVYDQIQNRSELSEVTIRFCIRLFLISSFPISIWMFLISNNELNPWKGICKNAINWTSNYWLLFSIRFKRDLNPGKQGWIST